MKDTPVNNYSRWTENEIAILMYGVEKGYKYAEIGSALGRTKSSVTLIGMRAKWYMDKSMDRYNPDFDLYRRAYKLYTKVTTGEAEDMKSVWDAKLRRTKGEEVVMTQTKKEEVAAQPEEKVEAEKEQDDSVDFELRERSFISINIDIDEEAVIRVLKTIFGA